MSNAIQIKQQPNPVRIGLLFFYSTVLLVFTNAKK